MLVPTIGNIKKHHLEKTLLLVEPNRYVDFRCHSLCPHMTYVGSNARFPWPGTGIGSSYFSRKIAYCRGRIIWRRVTMCGASRFTARLPWIMAAVSSACEQTPRPRGAPEYSSSRRRSCLWRGHSVHRGMRGSRGDTVSCHGSAGCRPAGGCWLSRAKNKCPFLDESIS